MAVTLTSTGITFSDSSTQNTAASGGAVGSAQGFNASGTWTRPSGVNTVVASMAGGVGGTGGRTYGWGYCSGGPGGGAKAITGALEDVSGNVSVTVGTTGAGGSSSTYVSNPGGQGNASTFGNLSSNGGGGGGGGHGFTNGGAGSNGNTSLTTHGPVCTGPFVTVTW